MFLLIGTLACSIALFGKFIFGKQYIAPKTGLQDIPSILLNNSVTNLAFSFNPFKILLFSFQFNKLDIKIQKVFKNINFNELLIGWF